MAGNYVDVPGPRMAYDRDGSVFFSISSGSIVSTASGAQMAEMNDDDDIEVTGLLDAAGGKFGLIFPELRDVVGYFLTWFVWSGSMGIANFEWSANTTTGLDGTWTLISATPTTSGSSSASPLYRTNIVAASITGAIAIRFTHTGAASRHSIYAFHVYGKPTAGQVRWLMLTDTGGTEVTGPYFDFADDPRGGAVEDKTFKVKNGHATLTANTITVSHVAPVDKSPSFADDYTFSDGGAFGATVSIASLAPGASSGTITVRRTTPSGAALGLETGVIRAEAVSWT